MSTSRKNTKTSAYPRCRVLTLSNSLTQQYTIIVPTVEKVPTCSQCSILTQVFAAFGVYTESFAVCRTALWL